MKIGVTRESLETELRKAIYEINTERKYLNNVFSKLLSKGYPGGDAKKILSGNVPLEFLSLIDLGVLASAIYQVTGNSLIDPRNYYNEIELKEIENYKETHEDDDILEYPLVFKNMIQQSPDQWIGIISIQDVVKLLHAKKIRYNYKTQRNPKFIKHRNSIIQKPNINTKSVKEIAEKMLKGEYIYDTLTFNIFADGEEDFIYDEEKKTLILNEGNLDMLDGMHRSIASENALLENPNLEGNFVLMLTNFDVNKANYYILQNDMRNPLDEEYKASLNVADESNSIVKKLNEDMESDIRGLIVTDEMLLKEGKGLTLFSIASKTVKKLWNPTTRREAKIISDYLIKFFNELIGLYPEELKFNIKKYRKNSFINHANMFIYYLTIAKELQGKNNWEDLLFKIMNKTDFSKKNEEWKGTITYIHNNSFNRKLPQIIKYYQEKIRGEMNEG